MVSPKEVDISNLLTILSVIVAVGALITQTGKLRLRFCMAWYDYTLGVAVFLLIHYLVFAPVLRSLGLYYSFGHWKWGLDSTSAVYLILLLYSVYFLLRIKFPILIRSKINNFNELISSLIISKRYDDLVLLVEPQLERLIKLSEKQGNIDRLYRRYYRPSFDLKALINGEEQPTLSKFNKFSNFILDRIKVKAESSSSQASEVIFNLVTSPDLTENLAVNAPYFGLKILKSGVAIRQDYISPYVDALLNDRNGRLYVELKNNDQIRRGSRLLIPERNRLLHGFFSDAEVAEKIGIYQGIGESIYRKLSEDRGLIDALKGKLGTYSKIGIYSCPISSGITLFEIMVHEGIHQGLQDHLWLHYYYYFTREIINQMVVLSESESDYEDEGEFPTRFHYLLYRMVSISTEWIEQCSLIDEKEIPEKTRSKDGFDKYYISKEATKVLGNMLQVIIESEKISDRFKVYLLEIVVRCHIQISLDDALKEVSLSLLQHVISGDCMNRHKRDYVRKLYDVFRQIDHVLIHDAASFESFIQCQLGLISGFRKNSHP